MFQILDSVLLPRVILRCSSEERLSKIKSRNPKHIRGSIFNPIIEKLKSGKQVWKNVKILTVTYQNF